MKKLKFSWKWRRNPLDYISFYNIKLMFYAHLKKVISAAVQDEILWLLKIIFM